MSSVRRTAVAAALVAILAAVVLVVFQLFSPTELLTPAPTPIPPPSVALTDVNSYGANFFLEWEPEEWKVDKTFEMAKAAGIHWVKEQFPWDSLQLNPGSTGYWDARTMPRQSGAREAAAFPKTRVAEPARATNTPSAVSSS